MRKTITLLAAATTLWAGAAIPASAESSYRVPDQIIVDLVDAPVTPATTVSPDGQWLLLLERPPVPTIADLSTPELRLAGVRINPDLKGPSRPNHFTAMTLVAMDGTEHAVSGLPNAVRIRNVSWSPDGRYIAFTVDAERVTLWVVDVARKRARQLHRTGVMDTFPGIPYAWHPDSRRLFARVDVATAPAPVRDAVPTGPIVQENIGRAAPGRTYQDLLQDAHDETLFEYFFTSAIGEFRVGGGVRVLSEPGMFRSIEPSPDGVWLLTERIERPFSYLVPMFRFPAVTEARDATRAQVQAVIDRCPLAVEIPIGFDAVDLCRRGIGWRSDAPASLAWAEAADGGDPRAEATIRDRVYLAAAPFDSPRLLAELEQRFRGIQWDDDEFALVYEGWWNTRRLRAWHVQPGNDMAPRLVVDRSTEDRYNDPGMPVTKDNASGHPVLHRGADGRLVLFGAGASAEGDRPFIDRWDPQTGESERLWRSEAPYYEQPLELLDDDTVLTSREAVDEPPNFYLRHLNGDTVALTAFPHPTPELIGVHKELIQYTRADGLPLSGTLYLPPGYDRERDGRLPLVVWAYPREFVSAAAAGQVTDSPYRFTRLSYWRPQFLVTQGYAVLDDATMPVVGFDGVEPNDSFISQLVQNGQAAVDAVVEMGIADRERTAIGGHSYGAFMTANIMAHADIFRAGIARSGAYNRSLTPFGFQREQRTIWDDTDLYIGMSPFFHADTISRPLLLIHGTDDNNSGTFPLQSERLYQAMRGLGGTTRLVMLPNESHGYRARESLLHMLWEMTEWLDRWVKEAE